MSLEPVLTLYMHLLRIENANVKNKKESSITP